MRKSAGTPPLTKEQYEEVARMIAKHGGILTHAAAEMKLPRTTVSHRFNAGKRMFGESVEAKKVVPDELIRLRDRVYELESVSRNYEKSTLTDEYVKRKLIGLKDNLAETQTPEWLVRASPGDSMPGVPCAMWSDWHSGEVVNPAQINNVNEYNLAIMHERVRKLVDKTVYLLRHHVVNPKFPGLVLNLGGDMLSGDIHDELKETNELPLMPTLLDLFGVLSWAISTLADEFGRLFIPCVTGNHGRNTKKPRAKDRNYTNFDWLLYQFLAKRFEKDAQIKFFIPDGPDALYSVCGHRYLLTHGDQFRGGDSQIGAIGPITRGNKRKLARNSAIDLDYDTMILGHWHQYMPLHRTIVNGSLKGYDEYANSMNFEYEPPTQALWLTHPSHGITMHMPIYLEHHVSRTENPEWVTWRQ